MSLNGFVLPSLTNAKPTVGLSEVKSKPVSFVNEHEVENSEINEIEEEEEEHGTLQKSIESLLINKENEDNIKENLEEEEEDNQDNEDNIDEIVNDTAEQNTPVSTATTDITSNIPTMKGPTLKTLLDARTDSSIIDINKQETNGKGMLLNESSDEDDEAEEEEEKEEEKEELEKQVETSTSNKLQAPAETKDESSSDEMSISEEKACMKEQDKNDLLQNNTQDNDELLINETLDDINNETNVSDNEIENKNEDIINKEVENEVNKIKLSKKSNDISENPLKINLIDNDHDDENENDNIDDETDNNINDSKVEERVQLAKQRSNSIKFIPNPPSNLSKQRSFDFQEFLVQFKSKDCEPIHKYLKSFIRQFGQRIWTVNEQVKLIKEFEDFLFNKLIQFEPFNELNNDEIKINNCKEGLEKLIMTKVYPVVFSPCMSFIKLTDSHKHDKIMDRKYLTNTYLYDWIEFKHLDLNINVKIDSKFITLASKELSKIDEFKSPRDKIVCILNSSKLIFGLIRQQEKTEENADSFVPLLIYILIHSKVKHLYSNLQYIERFRNEEFLIGETSYYVSTMQIACNFIISLNRDQLTINDEEFQDEMNKSKIRFEKLQQQQGGDSSISGISPSPSDVLTKSAEIVKQSLSNSINSIINNINSIDADTEEHNDNNNNNNNNDNNSTRQSTRRREAEEQLLQAQNESLAEARDNNAKEEMINGLISMFPSMDSNLIRDVVRECSFDAGLAVDALLELQ